MFFFPWLQLLPLRAQDFLRLSRVEGSEGRFSPWRCCQVFGFLGRTRCGMSLLGSVLRSARLAQLALNLWFSLLGPSVFQLEGRSG